MAASGKILVFLWVIIFFAFRGESKAMTVLESIQSTEQGQAITSSFNRELKLANEEVVARFGQQLFQLPDQEREAALFKLGQTVHEMAWNKIGHLWPESFDVQVLALYERSGDKLRPVSNPKETSLDLSAHAYEVEDLFNVLANVPRTRESISQFIDLQNRQQVKVQPVSDELKSGTAANYDRKSGVLYLNDDLSLGQVLSAFYRELQEAIGPKETETLRQEELEKKLVNSIPTYGLYILKTHLNGEFCPASSRTSSSI